MGIGDDDGGGGDGGDDVSKGKPSLHWSRCRTHIPKTK